MKNYLVLIFLLPLTFLIAQKPVQVKRIIYEQKEASFYLEQLEAWKKETVKTPKDANAWMNYYSAAHYARIFNKTEAEKINLDEIVAGVKKALPNSFEAVYLEYWKKSI